jgi:hypothetical protein
MVDSGMQTLSIAPLHTVFESEAEPRKEHEKEKEVITYSKGVQTSMDWSPSRLRGGEASDEEGDLSPTMTPRSNKRMSRRQKERDEEIRANLRKEIEEEIKAAQQAGPDAEVGKDGKKENFPFKTLNNEELNAVENSEDFIGFVERSTKVLERALDQQLGYDILADYSLGGIDVDEEDEGYGSSGGKKGRRIREIAQFWDERWSKKRMISDLGFSSKVCFLFTNVNRTMLTVCSFQSSFSLHTPRIPPRLMTPTVSSKSGISTCTTAPNTFSTPSPTSSLQNFRLSTRTSSSEVHTQDRYCYGIPAQSPHRSRRHHLQAPAIHTPSTPSTSLAHKTRTTLSLHLPTA